MDMKLHSGTPPLNGRSAVAVGRTTGKAFALRPIVAVGAQHHQGPHLVHTGLGVKFWARRCEVVFLNDANAACFGLYLLMATCLCN